MAMAMARGGDGLLGGMLLVSGGHVVHVGYGVWDGLVESRIGLRAQCGNGMFYEERGLHFSWRNSNLNLGRA